MLFVSPEQFAVGDSATVLVTVPLEVAGNTIVIDAVARILRCTRESNLFVTAVHFDTVQFRVDSPSPVDSPIPAGITEPPRRSL